LCNKLFWTVRGEATPHGWLHTIALWAIATLRESQGISVLIDRQNLVTRGTGGEPSSKAANFACEQAATLEACTREEERYTTLEALRSDVVPRAGRKSKK